MSAMNFCPPNPGSTVITRTISTSSTNGRTASTGVLGLIPIPTFAKKTKQNKKTENVQQSNGRCKRNLIQSVRVRVPCTKYMVILKTMILKRTIMGQFRSGFHQLSKSNQERARNFKQLEAIPSNLVI